MTRSSSYRQPTSLRRPQSRRVHWTGASIQVGGIFDLCSSKVEPFDKHAENDDGVSYKASGSK